MILSTLATLIGLAVYCFAAAPLPEFAEAIRNVTVPLGREAVLSCVIENLTEYKVGWLRADDQTILSLHRRVVTHNPRVTVTHDESRTWNLHIRQVKESDQGCYMCQINTALMKKQLGCIQVQVPPDIIDEASTSDVTVNEGDNVTLTCIAKGKPTPKIVWRREDGQKISIMSRGSSSRVIPNHATKLATAGPSGTNEVAPSADSLLTPSARALQSAQGGPSQHAAARERAKEVEAYHGEVLRLYRVTRQMMGAYFCIASNDVPPAVSKRVPLNVNFAPVVTATMNVVGAPLGSDVQLRCSVESFPSSITFWTKGRHHHDPTIIITSAKYVIEEERSGVGYRTVMTLLVRNFQQGDKSAYVCVATNSLGTAEASIQLYEVARVTAPAIATRPTAAATTTTTVQTTTVEVTQGPSSEGEQEPIIRKQNDRDAKHRFHETSSIAPSTSGRRKESSAAGIHSSVAITCLTLFSSTALLLLHFYRV